jgi:hypothetical protein
VAKTNTPAYRYEIANLNVNDNADKSWEDAERLIRESGAGEEGGRSKVVSVKSGKPAAPAKRKIEDGKEGGEQNKMKKKKKREKIKENGGDRHKGKGKERKDRTQHS